MHGGYEGGARVDMSEHDTPVDILEMVDVEFKDGQKTPVQTVCPYCGSRALLVPEDLFSAPISKFAALSRSRTCAMGDAGNWAFCPHTESNGTQGKGWVRVDLL